MSFKFLALTTVTIFAATSLSAAVAQTQPEATPSPVVAAKPVKPPKPRKICRETPGVNSRIVSSICKTQQEWATDDAMGGQITSTMGHH